MDFFENPELNLEKAGVFRTRESREIANSIFSIGFECLDRKLFNPEKCYDRAAELGVKWARVQTNWNLCEQEKGVYDFSGLDRVLDEFLKRGIQPWMSIVFGNPLYMPDIPHPAAVGFVPTEFGEECLHAWLSFIRACVNHCKNRVQWWEVWNEPNLDVFWRPGGPSGEKYAAMTALVEKTVHESDPDAKIAACMNAYTGPFITEITRAGIGNHIQAFSIHPYSVIAEDQFEFRMARLRAAFKRAGAGHVRLWQGECGYPAQPYFHKDAESLRLYNATETTQAKWILRRMVLDLANRMEMSSYFHMSDLLEGTYWSAGGAAKYPTMLGLLKTTEYRPKESFYAMKNMTGLLDGWCTPEPLELEVYSDSFSLQQQGALPWYGIRRATFLRHGWPLYSWYFGEDVQKQFHGLADMSVQVLHEAGKKIERPALYDPLSGNVYRIPHAVSDSGTLKMSRLPMTDYPLFLTDLQALELR